MEKSQKMDAIDMKSQFFIKMANHVLLRESENGLNFVISPVSLQIMLSLVAMGAKGRTLDQLLSYLGSRNVEDLKAFSSQIVAVTAAQHGEGDEHNHAADPLVASVNGAWVDQNCGPLKPSFERILKTVYKAEAKAVDFQTEADQVREEVNSWAQNATKGLIKELLPLGSLKDDTVLVFANALYFKGAWGCKFDSEKTTNKDFHLLNGQIVQVPFMTTKRNYHLYREVNGYKILKVPYQNGQDTRKFSMYFFLPDEKNGLQNLIEKFNSTPGFFNQDFHLMEEDLGHRFWIPKFKFSFEFEASGTLKELGLHLPFIKLKEFTEFVDSPVGNRLLVSKIFDKSFIEVNEDGTEAAASTGVIIVQQ